MNNCHILTCLCPAQSPIPRLPTSKYPERQSNHHGIPPWIETFGFEPSTVRKTRTPTEHFHSDSAVSTLEMKNLVPSTIIGDINTDGNTRIFVHSDTKKSYFAKKRLIFYTEHAFII